uniref:Integrase catalytic domain-containing protein n=1 Tax=Amazona collaria TaxID=241587 RepID=A0A8B9GIE4_9PSIT
MCLWLPQWAHEKAGHVGWDATIACAKQQGIHVPTDVAATIVHTCVICLAIQDKGTWIQPVGQIKRGKGPAEVWQIDYIGPLPEHRQQLYVCVAVDTFSGVVVAVPS